MKKSRLMLILVVAGIVALMALYSVVLGIARARTGEEMVASANQFLAILSKEQRAKAAFAFDDAERLNWHFIPRTRKGLPLKEMSEAERKLAIGLLKSGLGQRGYLKIVTIIQLENVLREIEKGSGPVRDPELYYFSIFGEPSRKGSWGWRIEGHHISFNFTIVKGNMVATTPAFLGANPAEVREGPKLGQRVLGTEEDLARALLLSLDDKQKALAIFDQTAPKDIISFNSQKADLLSPMGLPFSQLTARQQKMFEDLMEEYLTWMPDELANERREKLRRTGVEKVFFAWAGSAERKQPHYYRIQGPTFLVEYDNTQNNANHVHSVWRDFNGDFGRDLLGEHYQSTPHPK